jgi:hypothetical protein
MPRRFSEQEAQRIFARVAERQRLTTAAEEGLSLEDLEEAARAAGLDPRLVAHAAAELDTPGASASRTVAGAPVEVTESRLIAAPLDDALWTQLIGLARSEFGDPGMAGQIGHLREWTTISGGTKNGIRTRLSAEPAGDGTRLIVTRSIKDSMNGFAIAGAINGLMAVVFSVMATFTSETELWIPAAIMLVMTAAFLGGSQIGSRVWASRRRREFSALLDRMELAASKPAPSPVAAGRTPAERSEPTVPRGALDLDALDDPLTPDSPTRTRLRT